MKKSWSDALTACKSINGHLFEPANLQQNDDTADHAIALLGSDRDLWFGITDSEMEGLWKTASTKTTIPFENWNPGEPNNHMGNQECGKMKVSSSSANHGKWDDRFCGDSYRFICEL